MAARLGLKVIALAAAFVVPAGGGALAETHTPTGQQKPLGVYVAEPVSATNREWLEAARAGTIRAAIDRAFEGLCRPLVEVDGPLGRLSADALLRLAGNDDDERPALPKSARTRTLVIAAVSRAGKGFVVEISAIDVTSGKLRARESAVAKSAAGLGAAVAAAAAKTKAALPCPVWRGEIVLTTTETRAERGKDFSRTGQAEWTVLVRVDGKKTVLEGRYSIRVVTQRCNKLGKACSVHVLEGAGKAEPVKDAVSGFDPGTGNEYTVIVGDAVARLAMKTRLCRAEGKNCQQRHFETEQALNGARGTGTVWQSEDSVFGSVTLADTKKRKRVMSWQLERVMD
ncbi:MAG TPA: hypothetical protein VM325_08095 [Alphaproteobacteria bacterium]|nr:hypothetical protein [Alphaproteobacteria bacterium]